MKLEFDIYVYQLGWARSALFEERLRPIVVV